jgi:hypothetical protein
MNPALRQSSQTAIAPKSVVHKPCTIPLYRVCLKRELLKSPRTADARMSTGTARQSHAIPRTLPPLCCSRGAKTTNAKKP